jgi:3-deoxy-D-manno-octulosonic-acid transferase
MIIRALYTLAFYLATPLLLLRLAWRSRRQPAYLQQLGERWGHYAGERATHPTIWLHAVSVGEMRGAQPLVDRLLATYPQHRLLLTCMTPTGRATAEQLFGERATIVYLPYDLPAAGRRFLTHFQPQLALFMETEIWPNLLAACATGRIPTLLVNGRMSARSARGYARLGALSRPAFASLHGCAAQTEDDAMRLRDLGASPVVVCGNLKFDVTPADKYLTRGAQWREAIGVRPVWLAASTREGEEGWMIDALADVPDALLVLVPRHPQRFAEVAALLARRGIRYRRRSEGGPRPDDQVWLGDSMGEMVAYYRLADVAFIGGSLAPLGGQNLIEAAACGCPVLLGPHTFNFKQASEDAIGQGAALRIASPEELGPRLQSLLTNKPQREAMADAACRFAARHRGATERTQSLIAQIWARAKR